MRAKRSAMDPLQPVLHHVEEELQQNLEQACEKMDVKAESTGELEKLSEKLDSAARQAKAAAALRRRMNASEVDVRLNKRLRTPPDTEPVATESRRNADDARPR